MAAIRTNFAKEKLKLLNRNKYSGKGRPRKIDYEYLTLGEMYKKEIKTFMPLIDIPETPILNLFKKKK